MVVESGVEQTRTMTKAHSRKISCFVQGIYEVAWPKIKTRGMEATEARQLGWQMSRKFSRLPGILTETILMNREAMS